MRSILFPALVLSAAATAQAPSVQEFGLYPGVTSYSSRVTLPGPSAGAVVQTFEGDRFHGTGQLATPGGVVGRLRAFRAVIQDQDASTGAIISFSLLADDPANPGRPLLTAAGVLIQTGALTLPPGAGGPAAWLVTATLSTPADVIPQSASFHAAVDLPAAPLWTSDGLSVHTYDHGLAAGGPRPGTPILVGSIDRTNGNAWARPTQGMTLYLQLMVEAPVLSMGADVGGSPVFGIVGVYPDRARGDGLAWQVVDGNHPGAALALIATAGGFGAAAVAVPGIDGALWLDPQRLFPVVLDRGTLSPTGLWFTIVTWASFPATLPQVPISYQVLSLPVGSAPTLTNAVSTN